MILASCSGSEIQRVRAANSIVAESQAPQSWIHDHSALNVGNLPDEIPRGRIKSVDRAVTEVSDQNIVAEPAEVRACLRDAPRRIQRPIRSKTSDEITVLIEDIDNAVSRADHGVGAGSILQSVCHEYLSTDLLDVEWRKSVRKSGILERTHRVQGIKANVVRRNETVMKVCDRQIFTAASRIHDRETRINRSAGGIVYRQYRSCRNVSIDRRPGGNCAIFAGKEKLSRRAAHQKILSDRIKLDRGRPRRRPPA